jgi:hypothetical protein
MEVVARIVQESIDDDLDVVSASIVIIGGMKRLMNVTSQMNNELQREETLLGINPGRRQLRPKLFGPVNGAGLGWAV